MNNKVCATICIFDIWLICLKTDLDGEGVIEAASTDETVEKEAASHIYNPYDIRKRRSAMRAAIEKSIDDEIAGLAELDELERQGLCFLNLYNYSIFVFSNQQKRMEWSKWRLDCQMVADATADSSAHPFVVLDLAQNLEDAEPEWQ